MNLLGSIESWIGHMLSGPMPSPLPDAPLIRPGKMLAHGTAGMVEWEYWSDGVQALRIPVAGWFGGSIGITITELENVLGALKRQRATHTQTGVTK